jgi:hypothetical protein
MEKIKKGDIVYHQLSKLLFRCENSKHETWMNENPYYQKTALKTIDYEQWERDQQIAKKTV